MNQETHLPDIKVPADSHKQKHNVSKLPHKTTYTAFTSNTVKIKNK